MRLRVTTSAVLAVLTVLGLVLLVVEALPRPQTAGLKSLHERQASFLASIDGKYETIRPNIAHSRARRSLTYLELSKIEVQLTTSKFDVVAILHENVEMTDDDSTHCHFIGHVRGHETWTAALSTCFGLTGFVMVDGEMYVVEALHMADGSLPSSSVVYHTNNHKMGDCKAVSETSGVEATDAAVKVSAASTRSNTSQAVKQRSRRATTRYLELAISLDEATLAIYGDQADMYTLTIVNQVKALYRNGNFDYNIEFQVVAIDRITDNAMAGLTSNFFSTLLSQYRTYKSNKPGFVAHDAAALIFGGDIVSSSGSGVVGVAYLGVICKSLFSSASVTEEQGLFGTAITMAHELGHNFDLIHDGSCVTTQTNTPGIMAAGAGPPATAFYWSTCSISDFNNFVSQGSCMDNSASTFLAFPSSSPGTGISLDKQCELEVSPKFSLCNWCYGANDPPPCERLWCTNGSYAITHFSGALDGSVCRISFMKNGVCRVGTCVDPSIDTTTAATTTTTTTTTTSAPTSVIVCLQNVDFEDCGPDDAEAVGAWTQTIILAQSDRLVGCLHSDQAIARALDGGRYLLGGQSSRFSQQLTAAVVAGVTYRVRVLATKAFNSYAIARLSLAMSVGADASLLAEKTVTVTDSEHWEAMEVQFTASAATSGSPLYVLLDSVRNVWSAAVGWDKVQAWTSSSILRNGQLEDGSVSGVPSGWTQHDILTSGDHPATGLSVGGLPIAGRTIVTKDGGYFLNGGRSSVFSSIVTPVTRPGATYSIRVLGIQASTSYAEARVFVSATPNGVALAATSARLTSSSEWTVLALEYTAPAGTESALYINLGSSRDVSTALAGWDAVTVSVAPVAPVAGSGNGSSGSAASLLNGDFAVSLAGGKLPFAWTQTDIGRAGDHPAVGVYSSYTSPASVKIVTPLANNFLMGGRSSVFSQRITEAAVPGQTYVFRVLATQGSTSFARAGVFLSHSAGGPVLSSSPLAAVETVVNTVGKWILLEVRHTATSTQPLHANLASTRDVTTGIVAWSEAVVVPPQAESGCN